MLRGLLVLGLIVVIGVLVVGAFLFFYQNRLIFYPSLLARDFKYNFNSKFTENFLKLKDGFEVNYLQFHVLDPKGVILYFHGNAGALDSWGHVASELAEKTGYEVWIVDYPGYGKSSGPTPRNETAFLEIGRSLLVQIRDSHPHLPVFLYGRSIGSGIAGRLAAEGHVQGLILETPYTSLRTLAREIVWWVPSFLVRFDLDNAVLAKAKLEKILILHGTLDAVIPYHHSVNLEAMLKGRAKLVTVEGGAHNDLAQYPLYWSEVTSFLAQQTAQGG